MEPSNVNFQSKSIQEFSKNMEKVLNKVDLNSLTDNDIQQILNVELPTKSIENILLVTQHTNIQLEEVNESLLKNIKLIRNQIDFADTGYESEIQDPTLNMETGLEDLEMKKQSRKSI